jgi:hypothetical protein
MIINHLFLWHFLPVISSAANHPLGFPVHPTFFKSHSTQQQKNLDTGPCHNGSKLHFQVFANASKNQRFSKKQPGKETAIL